MAGRWRASEAGHGGRPCDGPLAPACRRPRGAHGEGLSRWIAIVGLKHINPSGT
jgi:hypothetical protein